MSAKIHTATFDDYPAIAKVYDAAYPEGLSFADPEMWKQIFSENAPALLEVLDAYEKILKQWREALDRPTPDAKSLASHYTEARDARLRLDLPTESS